MTERIRQAQAEVAANDPPVEINQYWVGYNSKDEVFRKLRILALHPDEDRYSKSKVWIFQEMPTKFRRVDLRGGFIGTCAEFNLRYVFTLEGIHET